MADRTPSAQTLQNRAFSKANNLRARLKTMAEAEGNRFDKYELKVGRLNKELTEAEAAYKAID